MRAGIIGGLICWIIIISLYQCARADYFYIYAGAGMNSGTNNVSTWIGEDDLGALLRIGYSAQVSKKYNIWFDTGVSHISHYNLGPPANDKDESFLNHFGLGFEKRWY